MLEDDARTALLIETLRLVAEGDDGKGNDAASMRARAAFELIAVLSYLEGMGVPFSLLKGMEALKIALANLQRGDHPKMFASPERRGRPPETLETAMLSSVAAAAVTLLVRGGYGKPEACKRVVDELRRRGKPIDQKALAKYRDRLNSNETRKAGAAKEGLKDTIVHAKSLYDDALSVADDYFLKPALSLGLSAKEASDIASERILDRIAPDHGGKPSVTLQNIERRHRLARH